MGSEIGLEHRHQAFSLPEWLGDEVLGDERYLSSYLAARPFTTWPDY